MKKKRTLSRVSAWAAGTAVLAMFLVGVSQLAAKQQDRGMDQLEKALRRAAVACYAVEGIYPPNVAYLQENYGIQIDESRYAVFYEVFAENVMPEITVVEIQP